MPRIPLADRFWSKVEKRAESDCWPWTAAVTKDGYGWIRSVAGGQMALAHRASWEINKGPIPDGLYVLHRCDNPACVNPGHLFLGTQIENMADMTAKGRRIGRGGLKGVTNHRAKLTDADVREIRRLHGECGMKRGAIAERFGVTQSPIRAIIRGDAWRHVK